MNVIKLGGLGVGSGRKDSFYFCLLEYFPDDKRLFLKTCQQLKQMPYPSTEDRILSWIQEFELETIIVDFPLSMPACFDCTLDCPGAHLCPVEDVEKARTMIEELLEKDEQFLEKSPKEYERERNKFEIRGGVTHKDVLSKSLKRKLKKEFVPYWNRALDAYIWCNYHDLLLENFNVTFNSFGNENLTQILRFKYLRKHFKKPLSLFETNYYLCLIELLKTKVISQKDLDAFKSIETAVLGRIDILKKIEKKYNLFIYENDLEVLIKKPRAFQAFIISLGGISFIDQSKNAQVFGKNKDFFIPKF